MNSRLLRYGINELVESVDFVINVVERRDDITSIEFIKRLFTSIDDDYNPDYLRDYLSHNLTNNNYHISTIEMFISEIIDVIITEADLKISDVVFTIDELNLLLFIDLKTPLTFNEWLNLNASNDFINKYNIYLDMYEEFLTQIE